MAVVGKMVGRRGIRDVNVLRGCGVSRRVTKRERMGERRRRKTNLFPASIAVPLPVPVLETSEVISLPSPRAVKQRRQDMLAISVRLPLPQGLYAPLAYPWPCKPSVVAIGTLVQY